MMILNSFTVVKVKVLKRDDRTAAVVAFCCRQIKLEGICLALAGKFLQKEFLILFLFKTIL